MTAATRTRLPEPADGPDVVGRLRRLARRALPREVRLRLVLARRAARDRLAGTRFAHAYGEKADFPHEVCSYSRPIIIYQGQEEQAEAKRWNNTLVAGRLDGLVIAPGEVFSVWQRAGRPSADRGYGVASAIHEGRLTTEVGGAVCLMSTVLYNAGLLGGLEVVERHCHSVDAYGSGRYFELGRDASIEYGYADLRLGNPHPFPVLLAVEVAPSVVTARLLAPVPPGFQVEIDVEEPVEVDGRMLIGASRRVVRADGGVTVQRLPDSVHRL